jgi:predicted transcriptional regulator
MCIDYTRQLRSPIELTLRQKTVPSALIDLHQRAEEPVTGEEIAHEIERSPGAIRNQMRTLAALNSVEGRRGPRGGYKPTSTAYEALKLQQLDHPAEGPVVHKREPVGGAIVERIDLTNVYHSTHCRAELTLQGSLTPFHTKLILFASGRLHSRSLSSRERWKGKTRPATYCSSKSPL